jgi:hypothetical protein
VAKKVENALEVAGLSSRDVTPFVKVRVTSIIQKISASETINKEGLITIWNPTEKQVRYNHLAAHTCRNQFYSLSKRETDYLVLYH